MNISSGWYFLRWNKVQPPSVRVLWQLLWIFFDNKTKLSTSFRKITLTCLMIGHIISTKLNVKLFICRLNYLTPLHYIYIIYILEVFCTVFHNIFAMFTYIFPILSLNFFACAKRWIRCSGNRKLINLMLCTIVHD